MYGRSYPQNFYNNSGYNYHPHEPTSNPYENFSENYCTDEQPSFYNHSEIHYQPHDFTSNSYGHPPQNYCTSTQPSFYNRSEHNDRPRRLTLNDYKNLYGDRSRFAYDIPQQEDENYGKLLVQTAKRLCEQNPIFNASTENSTFNNIGNYRNFEVEENHFEEFGQYEDTHYGQYVQYDDEQNYDDEFSREDEWNERIKTQHKELDELVEMFKQEHMDDEDSDNEPKSEDEPTPTIEEFQMTTFEIEDDDVYEVVSDTEKELDFNFSEDVHVDLKFDLPVTNELEETIWDEEVVSDSLTENDFDENTFFGITDDSEDEPTVDTIEEFQVTIFETKEEDFYDNGQDTMHELDFNLIERMDVDLELDISYPDKLKAATSDFQDKEVIYDTAEEDTFDEHAFFGIFDDDGKETNTSCQSEQFEHFDYEEQLGESDGKSNRSKGCNHKLGLKISDKVETSIRLHVSTKIWSFHWFLEGYTDKFLEYMSSLAETGLNLKLQIMAAVGIKIFDRKKTFKDNTQLYNAKSGNNAKDKSGGKTGKRSSQFIHHLHKSHFIFDIFIHIDVKLHFMLLNILHVLHLWVLSFTFRKKRKKNHLHIDYDMFLLFLICMSVDSEDTVTFQSGGT